jgi:thioredoxin-related protein
MKRAFLFAVMMAVTTLSFADDKKKAKTEAKPDDKEIHWITDINELQQKMAKQPRKVIVDMYTEWCGWCKKMDAATYTNPSLVKYVNNNFYAVKFDAERMDTINFQGKSFFFFPQYKANGWAIELMKGSMSYPTTVFMTENFANPTPIPGYQTIKDMEMFLTYFGDNAYKRVPFDGFKNAFVSKWDKGTAPDMAPPAGH